MGTELANRLSVGEIMERVIAVGDLSKLQPEERMMYYNAVCESVGVNPLTRPFEYITLNGKLTLYARKDCTDQLRSNRKINIAITAREVIDKVYVVTAQATTPDGRQDESTGAVPLPDGGEARANAYMKAETKAKRRVTLSICGLGLLDESEVDSIRDAKTFHEEAGGNGRTTSPMQIENRSEESGPDLMNDGVFLAEWFKVFSERKFSQDLAQAVLDQKLAAAKFTLEKVTLGGRRDLLNRAVAGEYDARAEKLKAGPSPANPPSAQPAAAPASQADTASAFQDFRTEAMSIGGAKGVTGGDVLAGIGKWLVKHRLKGKEATIPAEKLTELLVAMEEDRFNWTSGEMMPQQPVGVGA